MRGRGVFLAHVWAARSKVCSGIYIYYLTHHGRLRYNVTFDDSLIIGSLLRIMNGSLNNGFSNARLKTSLKTRFISYVSPILKSVLNWFFEETRLT